MLPSAANTSSQYLRVTPQTGYHLASPHSLEPLQNSQQQNSVQQQQAPAQLLQYPLQNLSTLFSQPHSQGQFGTAPVLHQGYKNDLLLMLPQTRQNQAYSLQAPELPVASVSADLRVLPQTLLPHQQQPPHALLPRMLILHPFQVHANEYYVASSGLPQQNQQPQQQQQLQPQQQLQQQQQQQLQQQPQQQQQQQQQQQPFQHQDQHYHLQIPYYLQQAQVSVVPASTNTVQQQYQPLLPSNNSVVLQGTTSGGGYGLYQPQSNSGGYPNMTLQGSVPPQGLLAQFQYPMLGQVAPVAPVQLSVPQTQAAYNQSPTLLKMNLYSKGLAHGGYDHQLDSGSRQPPYVNGPSLQYNVMGDSGVSKMGSGAKKNECPVCQKVFKRPSSLQIHFSIHTGVKLYKCEWDGCGRLFNVKSNMTRHFKLHLKNEKG